MNKAQEFIKRILISDIKVSDKIRCISAWANTHTKKTIENPNAGLIYSDNDIDEANQWVISMLLSLTEKEGQENYKIIIDAELLCIESPSVWGCMDKLADNYDPEATMNCCCKYTSTPINND